ncbi:restriction endonuclease subunit S [Microcoleus sp. POL10_C6]|uniref:restriction endonuclease subunit S n=1 Tax=Microcoleus sp. POL10_C6 TaxID=2818852 RepID=UPI002FCFAAC2
MDFKTFLENFDAIAEAPGGIPKLRLLILDLAVRGKLVPQNPEDESADSLLEDIKFEKAQFINNNKLGRDKPVESVVLDNFPFEIPKNWIYSQIGELFVLSSGTTPSRTKQEYFINGTESWVKTTDLNNGIVLQCEEKITQQAVTDCNLKYYPPKTICIAMYGGGGTIGKSGILGIKTTINQSVCGIYPSSYVVPEFIHIYVKSIRATWMKFAAGLRKDPNINAGIIRNMIFPLPPLAEQKRIVEKVDELMALCDRYEAAKQTRDNLRQKLRGSAIASIINAETDEELDAAWIFVRDNWHNISQHAEDIDSLRQTLLHLAVRGKLVPQNPYDEPAEKLLKVIATKHASYTKKLRQPKGLPSLKDVDKPFELPLGWCWCRFTEIGQLDRGKSKHRPRNDSVLYENGSIPLVQTGDVARANGIIQTYTTLYNNQGLAQSRLWSKGTLCITIAANIGDSAILGFDACFPDSIVGFLPTQPIPDSRYFEFFIRTLKSRLEDFAPSTAQKNINLGILDEVLIPLPPLAEQKRIVAKVDELMKLCDQLEASLRESQQQAESLAASAISHLTI